MGILTTIYQTIRNSEKPDEIEEGPFLCSDDKQNRDAWLGRGYYFWDTHIELAHKWGVKSYGASYVICESQCIIDDKCWDLHGNGNHRLEFEGMVALIKKEKGHLINPNDLRVPKIIEFMKKKGIFEYDAIRICGTESFRKSENDPLGLKYKFESKLPAYYTARPEVQICLLRKTSLERDGYRIVHPDYMREDFTI